MTSTFHTTNSLRLRARALTTITASLGHPSITDRPYYNRVPAHFHTIGGAFRARSSASSMPGDPFPVVMVGAGNVMFGRLASYQLISIE